MESVADEPKPQAENFRDLARKLECDEDEAAFEDKVRKIANSSVQQPPKDQPKAKPR
jgi:hypothetical protein